MRPFRLQLPAAGVYARLLGNWGLGIAGLACALPTEGERRCPLRPLAETLRPRPARDAHGPG